MKPLKINLQNNALDVTFSFEKLCVEIPKMLQDAPQLLSAMFGLYLFVHWNLGPCPKTVLAYFFALKSWILESEPLF